MTTLETQHTAFQLKGSLFTLTVLQLLQPDVDNFEAQLRDLVETAPKFFNYAPVVIDLQLLPTMHYAIDFAAMSDTLRSFKMIPVGIRGGTEDHNQAAMSAGLAVLAVSKNEETKAPPTSAKAESTDADSSEEATSTKTKTKLVTKPVRSGQQIYSQGGDLIVLAPVSHGAELLADGNIHIYAPLRGRALAGISGDEHARIFCSSLEAELISVAGHYIINETLMQNYQQKPHQIYLEHGKLRIQPL